MIVARVPISDFLPYAIRVMKSSGYAGLMVMLSRTADARAQHEELTRDWSSIHAVTGPLLAVLCPDPQYNEEQDLESLERISVVKDASTKAYVPGLQLLHPSEPDKRAFAKNFWEPVDGGEPLGSWSRVWELSDAGLSPRSRAPRSSEDHQVAWTLAASSCASFFGISERAMPSILVLSLWEEIALLLVHPRPYLYKLSKAIVERLDDEPDGIIRQRMQIKRHEREIRTLELRRAAWVANEQHEITVWRDQIKSLDANLATIESIEPSLIKHARDNLRQALAAGSPAELASSLQSVDTRLTAADEIQLGGRIRRKIARVIAKLELGYPEPFVQELQHEEAQVEEAQKRLTERQASLGLADAVTAAYQEESGETAQPDEPGRKGLEGWMLRTIGSI